MPLCGNGVRDLVNSEVFVECVLEGRIFLKLFSKTVTCAVSFVAIVVLQKQETPVTAIIINS